MASHISHTQNAMKKIIYIFWLLGSNCSFLESKLNDVIKQIKWLNITSTELAVPSCKGELKLVFNISIQKLQKKQAKWCDIN